MQAVWLKLMDAGDHSLLQGGHPTGRELAIRHSMPLTIPASTAFGALTALLHWQTCVPISPLLLLLWLLCACRGSGSCRLHVWDKCAGQCLMTRCVVRGVAVKCRRGAGVRDARRGQGCCWGNSALTHFH